MAPPDPRLALEKILSHREKHLEPRPIRSIAESLGGLSKAWTDPKFSYRKKAHARLQSSSGFTRGVSKAILDSIFHELTTDKIWRMLGSELGDPRVLDGFRKDSHTGIRRRARGPRLITHIFSSNVPNPAIFSFVFGLLVKSANAGKISGRDPGFLDIYLESLASFDSKLADATHWIGADKKRILSFWIRSSDAVTAYGSDETIQKLRREILPGTIFSGYGHRVSCSFYAKETLTKSRLASLAYKTARDAWMADQRGCLSPLVVFIQKGGEVAPDRFAREVSRYMEGLTQNEKFSKAALFSRAFRHELLKNISKIRRVKGQKQEFLQSLEKGRWAVLVDEGRGNFLMKAAGPAVRIRVVSDVEEVYQTLRPFKSHLQAVALEAPPGRREKLAEAFSRFGADRIAHAGEMQRPPLSWRHDGKFNLASWVRWTDLEAEAVGSS